MLDVKVDPLQLLLEIIYKWLWQANDPRVDPRTIKK